MNVKIFDREVDPDFIKHNALQFNKKKQIRIASSMNTYTFNYTPELPKMEPDGLTRLIVKIKTNDESQQRLMAVVANTNPADKVDTLFSFMRTFPQQKSIVFFSTCAQVAFIYEAFCKLNVGCSILHLTSRMSQNSRQETFYEFRKQKYGYLLTTDVAARGVDIPDVQTVIQFDCPTSVSEYQHRCGRCTRMSRIGMSVLFLPSCECFFKKELEKAQLTFEDRHVKLRNAVSIRDALCMTVASDARLKALSELALKSYYRSLMSQKDKRVFRIADYDFNKISQSYGLEMQVQVVDEDAQEV